jgi:hypothetical protein
MFSGMSLLFLLDVSIEYLDDEFDAVNWGLRQSNKLKTMAKLEKYKTFGIDTICDKSRDFDLVPLTS